MNSEKVGEGSNMQHETRGVWDWRRGLTPGEGGSLVPRLFWRHASFWILRRWPTSLAVRLSLPLREQLSQDSLVSGSHDMARLVPMWSHRGLIVMSMCVGTGDGGGLGCQLWMWVGGSPAGCPEIQEGSKGKSRPGAQRI